MTGVRVKALMWASIDGDDETGTGRQWVSAGMHGDYCVEERFDGGFDLWVPNTPEPDQHVSLEAAQAAGGAKHQVLTIAALEPQDAPAVAEELVALRAENARLREALTFYANPEVYRPHPHGPAFDRRDVSYVATAALTPEAKS